VKGDQYHDDVAIEWNKDMNAADVAYVLYQAPVLWRCMVLRCCTRRRVSPLPTAEDRSRFEAAQAAVAAAARAAEEARLSLFARDSSSHVPTATVCPKSAVTIQ